MARTYLGNIKGDKYVVESDVLKDDTGNHHYEIYNDGTAMAWGVTILNNINFDFAVGDFFRLRQTQKIDPLINFESETVTSLLYIDNRSNAEDCFISTANNNGAFDNIRVFSLNTTEQNGTTLYINYQYRGNPL